MYNRLTKQIKKPNAKAKDLISNFQFTYSFSSKSFPHEETKIFCQLYSHYTCQLDSEHRPINTFNILTLSNIKIKNIRPALSLHFSTSLPFKS